MWSEMRLSSNWYLESKHDNRSIPHQKGTGRLRPRRFCAIRTPAIEALFIQVHQRGKAVISKFGRSPLTGWTLRVLLAGGILGDSPSMPKNPLTIDILDILMMAVMGWLLVAMIQSGTISNKRAVVVRFRTTHHRLLTLYGGLMCSTSY